MNIRMPEMNTAQYMKFWNGPFGLTEKELLMLAALVDSKGDLCSMANKELAGERTETSVTVMNTYIKRLKDKKALKKHGKNYKLAPLLVKRSAIEISFNGTS